MSEQVPTKDLFKIADQFNHGDIDAAVVCEQRLICISGYRNGQEECVWLDVNESRAIRAWLDKVIP